MRKRFECSWTMTHRRGRDNLDNLKALKLAMLFKSGQASWVTPLILRHEKTTARNCEQRNRPGRPARSQPQKPRVFLRGPCARASPIVHGTQPGTGTLPASGRLVGHPGP